MTFEQRLSACAMWILERDRVVVVLGDRGGKRNSSIGKSKLKAPKAGRCLPA